MERMDRRGRKMERQRKGGRRRVARKEEWRGEDRERERDME